MYDFLPWAGLVVLFFLCLPILPVQRIVLDVSSWVLRFALVGLLAGGAYLWFRPHDMPPAISAVLNDFPGLLALLPERGSPAFALCAACWIVAVLVPILVAIDVTRRRVAVVGQEVTKEETRETVLPMGEPVVEEMGVPILRPIERRTAAAALAGAGSRGTQDRRENTAFSLTESAKV
jgi:hypothetical protein